jgi:hypothetical protein
MAQFRGQEGILLADSVRLRYTQENRHMKQKKQIVVGYHADCQDGFGAAWVAWKKLGNRAEYIPLPPDSVPEQAIRDSLIYFVDLCPRGDKMRALKKAGNVVIVIDHHISSREFARHADDHLFDITHSGAALAWKYFYPKQKLPALLRYVEDRDLWRFKFRETGALTDLLLSEGYDFAVWSRIAREFENTGRKKELLRIGEGIHKYRNAVVRETVKGAQLVEFAGKKVLALNTSPFSSESGHVLYGMRPPFSIVWRQEKDAIRVSLRSNGTYDVSKLAQKYGGGGHRAAAGFMLPAGAKLPWKVCE